MRVLVCGSRHYTDKNHVYWYLNKLHVEEVIDVIIHGDAPGVDRMAEAWAKSSQVNYQGYPARWLVQGSAAGPIRNKLMLELGDPDLVVAFPGGKGTANMVRLADDSGVEVRLVLEVEKTG